MTRSLRSHLVGSALTATATLLATFGLAVYLVARMAMVKEFEAALVATAQAVAGDTEFANGRVIVESEELEEYRQFAANSRRAFYELWGPDGAVLHRSASLRGRDMPRYSCTPDRPKFYVVTLPTGRPGRVIATQFQPRLGEGQKGPAPVLTLIVAHETHALDERLAALAWLLAAAGGATMLTAILVTGLAIRRGLRPVNAMVSDIEGIDAGRLAQRVSTGLIPSELRPVGEKLNDMLTRLEEAFDRERSFTSDAAHELRTPLAGARAAFEVALSRSREAPEYAETIRDGLAVILQMQGMVESLLTLARLDTRQVAVDRQEVDLTQLARSCWAELAGRADDRRLRLEDRLPDRLVVSTDRPCLLLALRNLLDNAVTYADAGGLVRLEAQADQTGVELTIANTGCALAPTNLPRVFDPFWRGDAARSDTGQHWGLGLSLVQRALAAVGGTAVATIEPPATFTVRVRLGPCP